MEDYVKKLDALLSVDNRKLLDDSGPVSYEQAIENILSSVEKAYLESIKAVAKEIEKK